MPYLKRINSLPLINHISYKYAQVSDVGPSWSSCFFHLFTVQCTFITPPNGGNFVTSSNGSVSITTFTCDTGSTISGDITLECGPDGAWSSMIPDCGME